MLVCLYASPCVSLQVLDLERRELGASGICIVSRLTLLVCLYASPCVLLQVLELERRELLTMDAIDQSPARPWKTTEDDDPSLEVQMPVRISMGSIALDTFL